MSLAIQSPAHEHAAFLEGAIACKRRRVVIDQYRGPANTQSTTTSAERDDDDDGDFLKLSSSSLRCLRRDSNLTLSSSELCTLRRHNTKKLLHQHQKLVLVLDLDNTLLHTILANKMTPEEEYMAAAAAMEEKDIAEDTLFEWKGLMTKLRPGVRIFLEEASKMYDMYIYTMGCREYALQMATYLDPEGVYFESKILSREDCTQPKQKGLDVVLAEERTMVILDDNKHVWTRHLRNLIPIEKYSYFGLCHGVYDVSSDYSQVLGEIALPDHALELKLCLLHSIHRLFFNPLLSSDICERDVRELVCRFI